MRKSDNALYLNDWIRDMTAARWALRDRGLVVAASASGISRSACSCCNARWISLSLSPLREFVLFEAVEDFSSLLGSELTRERSGEPARVRRGVVRPGVEAGDAGPLDWRDRSEDVAGGCLARKCSNSSIADCRSAVSHRFSTCNSRN